MPPPPSPPSAGATLADDPSSAGTAVPLSVPRQQRARRSTRRVLGGLLVVALLALLAGWALLGSSWLAVSRVTVSGERTLSQRDVLAAASVELGTPLVRLDLGQIQRRVAALRPVAHVTVHRAWPHTVAIRIVERRPAAALRSPRGGWGIVDRRGVVFRHVSRAPALPVVDVASPRDRAVVRAAATVATFLPAKLLADVRSLSAKTMDSVTLHLKDGREVRWGSAAESTQKVRVLAVLLKQQARVYDVSVPAQPTTAQ